MTIALVALSILLGLNIVLLSALYLRYRRENRG